jgi:hypothetical protein
MTGALVTALVYMALGAAASSLVFQRRDVT